jgi:hypothetical protein
MKKNSHCDYFISMVLCVPSTHTHRPPFFVGAMACRGVVATLAYEMRKTQYAVGI